MNRAFCMLGLGLLCSMCTRPALAQGLILESTKSTATSQGSAKQTRVYGRIVDPSGRGVPEVCVYFDPRKAAGDTSESHREGRSAKPVRLTINRMGFDRKYIVLSPNQAVVVENQSGGGALVENMHYKSYALIDGTEVTWKPTLQERFPRTVVGYTYRDGRKHEWATRVKV